MTAPVPPESGVDLAPGSTVPAESTGGLRASEKETLRGWLNDQNIDVRDGLGEGLGVLRLWATVERILATRDAEHARHEAAEVARVRAEAVHAFVQHVASSAAYNGAGDLGQRFYDEGLNPWLYAWATAFLAREADGEVGHG